MSDRVLIAGGARMGRTLQYERAFRKALADGKDVFTGPRNGVWFRVSLDGQDVVYTALTARPEGV